MFPHVLDVGKIFGIGAEETRDTARPVHAGNEGVEVFLPNQIVLASSSTGEIPSMFAPHR